MNAGKGWAGAYRDAAMHIRWQHMANVPLWEEKTHV